MTNISRAVLSFIFIASGYAATASAQVTSLADIGGDKYISDADGFKIAVPHQCVNMTAANGNRTYLCDVKEGRVSVIVQPADPKLKTEADIADDIKNFDDSPFKAKGVTLLAESPIQIGSHRGVGVMLNVSGDVIFAVSLFAVGRPTYIVSARALNGVTGAPKLIGDAFASFDFTTKTK